MKLYLLILTVAFNWMVVHGQTNKIDTPHIFHITDSIATIELEKYDEKSNRQTGVPRSVQHFDKTIVIDEANRYFLVNYTFNRQKFYAENRKQETYLKSTGFPDVFNISYDLATKKATLLLGE